MKTPQDLTVFGELDEPERHLLSAADLLSEPDHRSPEWCASAIRRIVAASARPIAQGVTDHAQRARLERAGWFVAGEGADLESAREACWPAARAIRRAAIGAGSLAPSLVLIGERTARPDQVPFASRSGVWLFRALRELGHDELSCYVGNAIGSNGKRQTSRLTALRDALQRYEPTWVALGREAERSLKAAGIEHIQVCHPAHHRRYHYREDVTGYAKRMTDAGLERGPGVEGIVRVDDLPELPAPYDLRSTAYAPGRSLGTGKPRKRSQNRQLSVKKAEEARRLYVTGVASSLIDAARQIGVHPDRVREVARAEGWAAEREDHQRQITEETKAAQIRQEAKSASNARRMAWAATERALAAVVRKLRDGELDPDARDAKTLADCALALTDRVADPDEAREDLRGRSLRDLVQQVAQRFEHGLGGGA